MYEEIAGCFPNFTRCEISECYPEAQLTARRLSYAHIDTIANDLLRALALKINEISLRTLISEYHNVNQNHSVPYVEFNATMEDENARKVILQKYPELSRILEKTKIQWRQNLGKLSKRYQKDYHLLHAKFQIKGEIKSVELNKGDSHNGQESVAILHFDRGDGVVYKPGPKDCTGLVAATAKQIAPTEDYFGPIFPNAISREGYQWQEYIIQSEFTETSAHDYFTRFGRLSALLTAIGANDMHEENIVATLRGPILVDTETLTSPNPKVPTLDSSISDRIAFHEKLGVLRTLLFPTLFITSQIDYEMSAVGIPKNTQIRKPVTTVINKGTDDISYGDAEAKTKKYSNRVCYRSGEQADPRNYRAAIKEGFQDAWGRLVENRESTREAIRNNDAGSYRVVPRPTWLYARFLQASMHPTRLEKDTIRRSTLQNLGNCVPSDETQYYHGPMLASEVSDLMNADIPHYTVLSNGDVYHVGTNTIVGKTEHSVTETVLRWLELSLTLTPESLLRTIDMALSCAGSDPYESMTIERNSTSLKSFSELPEAILGLRKSDIESGWITTIQVDSTTLLGPALMTMYESGGCLFASWACGSATDNDGRLKNDIQARLNGMFFHEVSEPKTRPGPHLSAYTAGFADSVTELELANAEAIALSDRAWNSYQQVFRSLPYLLTRIYDENDGDFLNGISSAITAVNQFKHLMRGGRRIGSTANEVLTDVLSMLIRRVDEIDQLDHFLDGGLAHGLWGRLLALSETISLLESGSLSVRQELKDTIASYGFSRLKQSQDAALEDQIYAQTWCKGYSGVAMATARTAMNLRSEHLPVDLMQFDSSLFDFRGIFASRQSTLAFHDSGDLSLCHGEAGVLTCLATLADFTGDSRFHALACSRHARFTSTVATDGWRSGLGSAPSAEGFFVGRSGWDMVSNKILNDGPMPRMITFGC